MIETTTKVNDGAIVIFAKYPISGSSKTRLSPLLGDDGSASLARAMLSDVIEGISFHVSTYVWTNTRDDVTIFIL